MAPFRRSFGLFVLVAVVAGCGAPGPTARPGSAAASEPSASSAAPSGSADGSAVPPSAVSGGSFDPRAVTLTLESVVSGLTSPLAVTDAGDGSGRLFVAEQGGIIRIVRDGGLVDRPFLEISDRVTAGGERGLLGLAFHPNFPADPRLFVDYTDGNGDTRVSSFTVDPSDPDRADPESEVNILFVKQPYANHNGGALAFGPDGFLYIAMGDGGSGGDPHENGQSPGRLLGKILRIDVDRTNGDAKYAIPGDYRAVCFAQKGT